MSGINRPATGRFPLHTGRPLVFRCRRRGVWGWTCDCHGHNNTGSIGAEEPNRDDWADALQAAQDHVQYWHKTPAELETARLEALFARPAYSGAAP